MEEISIKEWLISIAVALLALAILIFINPFVKDSMLDDIRSHTNALQVTDAQQFKYARTTQVGNVFAYGRMTALQPASLPELVGKFAMIEKVTERYTMKTKQVCDGYDSDGDCTGYHTETYYEWDRYDTQTIASGSFEYLSETFSVYSLNLSTSHRVELSSSTVSQELWERIDDNCIYEEDSFWTSVGDLRYYYNVLPESFNVSMFVRFDGNEPQAVTYYEMNPSQVMENKEVQIRTFDFWYYTMGVLLIGCVYLYWAYHLGDVE